MRKVMTLWGLVGVLLISAGSAQAISIDYSAPYSPENVGTTPHVVASLPKFDPALGTLVSVTLTLDSNIANGSIVWDNEAGVPSDVTLGIGAEVTATAMTALTAVAIPVQTGTAIVPVDADNDGDADFAGTDSFSVSGGIGNDSDTDSSTNAGVLALFTAAFVGETFDAFLSSTAQTLLITNGGYGPIDPIPGTTDGVVKVTYEYIPEPMTMSLLGMGIMGLLRRRNH